MLSLIITMILSQQEVIVSGLSYPKSSGNDLSSRVFQPLDILVVPHAHCDVGWLYTVDGYWRYAVHDILNTVISALDADSTLRFIWSEIKWIQMWWDVATEQQKKQLHRVVKSGQFEFVGGGWSQADEVTTTWFDQIDKCHPHWSGLSQTHRY